MTTWLVGLAGGILAAFLLLSWGIAMPFLAPVAFAVGALARPRPAGLSGALVGLGATIVFVLAVADLACRGVPGCHGPDNAGWYALGIAAIAAGGLIVIATTTRERGAPMIRSDDRPAEPPRPEH